MNAEAKPGADVLRKIRKLLRLAKSNNPNEAANALAQAQRLMDEHRVEMASIDADDEEQPNHDLDPLDGRVRGKTPRWRKYLAQSLAVHNGCSTVLRGGQIEIIGRASDVAVLRYMYAYLLRQLQRLVKRDAVSFGRAYTANYRMGAVIAVDQRLRAERTAGVATSGSTALAIVDRRAAEADALRNRLTRGRFESAQPLDPFAEGVTHGYDVGRREIELHRALRPSVTPEARQLRSGEA